MSEASKLSTMRGRTNLNQLKSPLSGERAVSEASKLSTMRGRTNLNQLKSPLSGERAVSEASKLSTMRGARYNLMLSKWSPLPDLNWGLEVRTYAHSDVFFRLLWKK